MLKRNDLQGKTGTTNDAKDGWFAGYQQSLVAVAWMGYDQPKTLGSREFGAQLALPIWVEYMGRALRGVPQQQMPKPDGITTVDGELFYADRTPGSGFVASIGLDTANPMAGDATTIGRRRTGGHAGAADAASHDRRAQADHGSVQQALIVLRAQTIKKRAGLNCGALCISAWRDVQCPRSPALT